MSGYYPPGVTGNEPQIAGVPTREATREVGECPRVGERVIRFDMVRRTTSAPGRAGRPFRRVRATVVECDFSGGDVDGELADGGSAMTFYWECPTCGTENETDVDPDEFGPDPDDIREADWELEP